ncbi:MAG: carbon starvation protein A [Duncaniella sp.]|uniref:carbon starvation CstA family protein n=1 Tax=Duncaniella sp. TaxID=2518496 RepID=UPI0023C7E613|nr:carbon starvation CstA family protein [Duncaniella sp.]MDE5989117.1 carbon starvation protein A [Duncaniella sp.]
MITFAICLILLITAYFTYGRYLEKLADINPERPTPVDRCEDGVDFIKLPRWRVFLIQLLNIAGTGPIFGAILGACFGPVAFLWITLGGIFFGAMHDFMSGVMIMRHDGRSLPEIIGIYMGVTTRSVVRVFSIALMVLVGAVFILSPAELLASIVPEITKNLWVWIILAYYILATMLPVDKVIGKVYPVFGIALIAMAVGLLIVLLSGTYTIPELTTLHNFQLDPEKLPIVPTLFITIACGAISGFHATQSPLMARCITNEKKCRSVFYGSMISESIIALIWAAIAMAFFNGPTGLGEQLARHGGNAAWAVDVISHTTLGKIGAVLALLGVVAAPITSGDTAFRGARLIVADIFKIDQRPILKRFAVCIPLFVVGYGITLINFDIVWRYFAWANQTLAAVVLWSIYIWLARQKRNYWVALIPAVAMTFVVTCFIFVSPQFFGIANKTIAFSLAALTTVGFGLLANRRVNSAITILE